MKRQQIRVPVEITDAMIASVQRAIAADASALYRGEPDSIRIFWRAALRAAKQVKKP